MSGDAGRFGPTVYAAWRRSSLGEITDALEHRLLLDLAAPIGGAAVLDVGCGDGTLLALFGAAGATTLAGCDPDPRMAGEARARLDGAATIHQAGGEALPFADAAFDLVTCITVLSFIPDPAPVLREMARVLRPGGRLVVGDLGRWSLWAARRRIRGWLGARLWRGAHFRSAAGLARLATDAGLRVETVRGAIFYPPWTAAARLMAPADAWIGRRTTLGAAFIALRAGKPPRG